MATPPLARECHPWEGAWSHGGGNRERAMRCANDHSNADVELFCRECGEIMPPLPNATEVTIRWLADPEPSTRAAAPSPSLHSAAPSVIDDDHGDAPASAV